jgi:hypothetical protein
MAWVATAVVGSAVIGAGAAAYGAHENSTAINDAANAQANSAQQQLDVQKQMFDTQRSDFAPYQELGLKGIADLGVYNTGDQSMYTQATPEEIAQQNASDLSSRSWYNRGRPSRYDTNQTYYKDRSGNLITAAQYDKLAKPLGEMPSYDQIVTDQMGNYNASPAFNAQNTLGQQALQRQLNARGLNYGATGASAGAELTQKLVASDYDKYRADLTDRYKALQGQYALKRDVNNQGYQSLLDQVKIGQGAANSAGQAAGQNAANASQTFAGLGQAQANVAMAQGRNSAQMYSNIGAIPGQAASMANSLGNSSWFNGGGAEITDPFGTNFGMANG